MAWVLDGIAHGNPMLRYPRLEMMASNVSFPHIQARQPTRLVTTHHPSSLSGDKLRALAGAKSASNQIEFMRQYGTTDPEVRRAVTVPCHGWCRQTVR